ncbi:hypothetical protein [Pantoea agglomerans]|uniref:Uncharacterized protein n=1 Tax=Enterobacter agglomerans TaxID=549 RepID=A0ACC5PVQ2_ENTAG|nr:hypothetical protein [Pantoea agglomerans]MBD8129297.1 hypothetical protein [Pantoea agglomerans]
MINPSYDDFAWADSAPAKKVSPARSNGVKIENQDGSIMFVAESVSIEIEEGEMSAKSYGQELLHALKLSWPVLVLIILAVFSFFQLTQNRIDSQMAEVRAQMAADRKSSSDDNTALRSDMTQGFNRAADRLDAISQRLEDKIQSSSDKTDSKLDKINASLNELRQVKPAN